MRIAVRVASMIMVTDFYSPPGVYGPGYEERRAQRIKDAYGIDVPVQRPSVA